MIAPHRIAEIQIARIGGRADNSTANRTNRGACRYAARGSTHKRTGTSTDQRTRSGAIARIGAATCQGQHGCRRCNDGKISYGHHCLLYALTE
jgi:hypothetical protein